MTGCTSESCAATKTSCSTTAFQTRSVGAKYTTEHRVYLQDPHGRVISSFHDIPLWVDRANGICNMICEIPRWSNAKLEIATGEPFNPIKQDVKKGALRFVKNCFPHRGYPWNYGALPQTWECPTRIDTHTGFKGDNDPIDAVEIGNSIAVTGEVKQVKILGVLGLLDEGETDWKIIVIDLNDPLADKLNNIADVDRLMPGLLRATVDWFRVYKIPDGKAANEFAFNGVCKDKQFALEVVAETHEQWRSLCVTGELPPQTDSYAISVKNACVTGSPFHAADAERDSIPAATHLPDAPLNPSVYAWSFIPGPRNL